MPSLRRTTSFPVVRSAPYPAPANSANGPTATRGNGHRRSSGSEISSRRVLADIEWWRVTDGQRDPDADQQSEDRRRDQDVPHSQILVVDESLGGAEIFSADMGIELPTTPIMSPVHEVLEFPTSLRDTNSMNFCFPQGPTY